MAAAGVASRRACEELIFDKKVKVNGKIVTTPQTHVGPEDEIIVNGETIGAAEKKVYYILNKPIGYICSTARKSRHSKLVLDLFGDADTRLFTVGRLDKETGGLILITNDGHFANRVIHPSFNIHKEYVAKTGHEITHHHLVTLSEGAEVEGVFVKPVSVRKVRKGTVKIVVSEGKKHEVRILIEAAGLEVRELTRTRIGSLTLTGLAPGEWRPLTKKEQEAILS